MITNSVARTLKNYAHQRESTGPSSDCLQLRPFSEWELLLKERTGYQRERKELAPRGSEFFPLRAVPYDMEITFAT